MDWNGNGNGRLWWRNFVKGGSCLFTRRHFDDKKEAKTHVPKIYLVEDPLQSGGVWKFHKFWMWILDLVRRVDSFQKRYYFYGICRFKKRIEIDSNAERKFKDLRFLQEEVYLRSQDIQNIDFNIKVFFNPWKKHNLLEKISRGEQREGADNKIR